MVIATIIFIVMDASIEAIEVLTIFNLNKRG